MTKLETVLIYAGIPALLIVVVFGLVFAGDARRGGSKRYRPGRPYEFHPVWFLSAPDRVTGDGSAGAEHKALRSADTPAALPAGSGSDPAAEWPAGNPNRQSVTGGASDRW